MSAPNKHYDPVEVTALSPGEIAAALTEALAAIAGALTLDELKAARLAHAGDRSPLALANAEIGALPPQARAVVVLRYWEDLSIEQVAVILQCSAGNVKSQSARALQKLREQLGESLPELALTD